MPHLFGLGHLGDGGRALLLKLLVLLGLQGGGALESLPPVQGPAVHLLLLHTLLEEETEETEVTATLTDELVVVVWTLWSLGLVVV